MRGVFAQVFCDFGPAFEVLDVDGEQQLQRRREAARHRRCRRRLSCACSWSSDSLWPVIHGDARLGRLLYALHV